MKEIPVLYYAVTDTDKLTDVDYEDLSRAGDFAFEEQMRLERLKHGRLKYYHKSSSSLQKATDKLLPVWDAEIRFFEEAWHRLDLYRGTRTDQPRQAQVPDDLPF